MVVFVRAEIAWIIIRTVQKDETAVSGVSSVARCLALRRSGTDYGHDSVRDTCDNDGQNGPFRNCCAWILYE